MQDLKMAKQLPCSLSSRLIRLPEVKARVGLGRSTIYRRMREGTFPLPRSLGGRAIAWAEEDVSAWIAERPLQEILLDQTSA
jgi:prophage regulatory protein